MAGRPHRTDLVFSYADAERARVVARSVQREAGDIEGDRTRASVSRSGRAVRVTVAAADLVALRAGNNTWCSLVAAAERAAAAGAAFDPAADSEASSNAPRSADSDGSTGPDAGGEPNREG